MTFVDWLTDAAERGKLTLRSPRTSNVGHHRSSVDVPVARLEFDRVSVEVVGSYDEAPTAVLGIAFGITDLEHLLERDGCLVWGFRLFNLAE